jgi:hypothetical protein
LTPTPFSARPASVYPLPIPAFVAGERTNSLGGEDGGSIFLQTQDAALYSTYIESSLITVNYSYLQFT